jgi:Tetratricopeptide repeat
MLGHEHPITGASVNAMGTLLADQRDYAGALPLYQRALTIITKANGPTHPDTMSVVANLSFALDALGRTEEAKALRERYPFTISADPKPS